MITKIKAYKQFSYTVLLIVALFLSFSTNLLAIEPQEVAIDHTHNTEHSENGPLDISAVALEHVSDSHSWHFWGEGHDAVSAPLPIILKTNNGLVCFMSSEFHHDNKGTVVVEKNGERFVMFDEKIYYANEVPKRTWAICNGC